MTQPRDFRPTAGGHIVDVAGFQLLLDIEIHKAQRLRYCVSLICLAADLPSRTGTRQRTLTQIVTPQIRATDAVAEREGPSVTLLLVDAEVASLPGILRRLTADLEPVSWSAGGACYPKTATRGDELLEQATEMMIQARQEGGHRIYVPS